MRKGGNQCSNSHYETNFGGSSAKGAGTTKIGFLKARQRRAFKKPIFIMRIAALIEEFVYLLFAACQIQGVGIEPTYQRL